MKDRAERVERVYTLAARSRRIHERVLDLHVDSAQAAGYETANERKRVGWRAPNTLLHGRRPRGTNWKSERRLRWNKLGDTARVVESLTTTRLKGCLRATRFEIRRCHAKPSTKHRYRLTRFVFHACWITNYQINSQKNDIILEKTNYLFADSL